MTTNTDKEKELYIISADTLMEIPYFHNYFQDVQKRIQKYIAGTNLNASVVTVAPEHRDSFWVSVLGKGYPAAHMGFRWCTGKLKIKPIEKFVKKITVGQDHMTFIGVRRAESPLRAKIYTRKDYRPGKYAPILDWTAHDVWEYLLTEPCPWGDHRRLIEVYRYSSDECLYGEKQGVCVGNARYGCWACPLQSSTQLDMIALNTGDPRYKLLKEYKEILVGMANRHAYRSRIRRNGQPGTGPFLVKIRQRLFAALKDLEQATGWSLITAAEEEFIHVHWQTDESIHHQPDNRQPMLWKIGEV
jgi:DNA sulfur modification protein DndC